MSITVEPQALSATATGLAASLEPVAQVALTPAGADPVSQGTAAILGAHLGTLSTGVTHSGLLRADGGAALAHTAAALQGVDDVNAVSLSGGAPGAAVVSRAALNAPPLPELPVIPALPPPPMVPGEAFAVALHSGPGSGTLRDTADALRSQAGALHTLGDETQARAAAIDDQWQRSAGNPAAVNTFEHGWWLRDTAVRYQTLAAAAEWWADDYDHAVHRTPRPDEFQQVRSALLRAAASGNVPATAALQRQYAGMQAEAFDAATTYHGSALGTATALDNTFKTAPDIATDGPGEDRDPDGRRGRRLRTDEVFRREEGGDRGGDHFSTDWAGRAVLERYLTGGEDWTLTDDPAWRKYMMDNQLLRQQLLDPTQIVAQDALNRYLNGGGAAGTFDQRFHAEIDHGEGIVGYQYLHGTERTVGDFQFAGNTAVRPLADGTYEVTLNSGYTWNDVIDPNPIYETDTWKSRFAELFTLGQADPYNMHITWHAPSAVILDPAGNVLAVRGYPAP